MFSMINWTTTYWQARRLWTSAMADAVCLGRMANELLVATLLHRSSRRDSLCYVPVRAATVRRAQAPSPDAALGAFADDSR